MPERPPVSDLFPHLTCREMEEVLGRFPTVEDIVANPLVMVCLRRHCLEAPVHEMDCAVGDETDSAAAVTRGMLHEAIDGAGCDDAPEEG
jgi:hypothetical protein